MVHARAPQSEGATVRLGPYAAPMYLSGATAEAGCWKPTQRRRMRLYRRTGWTYAHATRPPNCGDRVCWEGFPRPTFRLSRKAGTFWRENRAQASAPEPVHI